MSNISGLMFKQMLENGANNLNNKFTEIDALNVFPVPDGDTGTNMSLTFHSGAKEALKVDSEHVGAIAKVLSKGLLMGARGNSGVITSQIFRGFAQSVAEFDHLDAIQLSKAFVEGAKVAYKAVMRPVEGTILTVIREASEATYDYVIHQETITCEEVMDHLVDEAIASLKRTPELLPVLKEVGVVDSGGAGLVTILQGFQAALKGNVIAASDSVQVQQSATTAVENDEFGYCTEFIIRLDETSQMTFQEEMLKDALSKLGNSIVCVQDEEIVKVHVHTLKPGDVLNIGQRYGEFVKLKIENMQEQHDHIVSNQQETTQQRKKYALITVAAGNGLQDMFKELRADYVISGGQTMNPSTEDFVEAIKQVNAEHIFLLPNNSNIVLAAKQAAEVMDQLQVHVIESKTIPQGLGACIMFNPEVDIEENLQEMQAAVAHVKTGQITYAIKDTTFDGIAIKEKDYMGIKEKEIVISNPDLMVSTKYLIDQLVDNESEIVTIIYGEDVTEEQAQEMANYIEETYETEVELVNGQQPVYAFIIGVE